MVRRFAVALSCGLIAVSGWSAVAQDQTPPGASQEQMEAMMKAWQAFATPGEEHKKMAEMVGEWTGTMQDFSYGEPQTSEASAKFTLLMDGRYLMQEISGNMGGMEFKGMGLTGYNNQTKTFQEIWIDSMGTAIFYSEGKRLDEKTVESKGKMTMPGMGDVETRTLAKRIDKDTHEFNIHTPGPDGKEKLAVKITYTRKK